MQQTIQNLLKAAGVALWRIEEDISESAELYFVKKRLDMRRKKQKKTYVVTVYRDFEKNGKAMRGQSTVTLSDAYTEKEMEQAIAEAYHAASFVANPTFELPEPVKDTRPDTTPYVLEDCAMQLAEAMYSQDTASDAFLNSAEIFANKFTMRITTHHGADISFTYYRFKGEFVVQCKAPQDVEMYHAFAYETPDTKSLAEKVQDALKRIKDRARAEANLPSGTYTLLLSGDHVNEMLGYYTERSDASAVFAGYSGWKVGEMVEEATDGDSITMSLRATTPYSNTGVPMVDRPLLDHNKLCTIHGGDRFCSYLGISMTGIYNASSCEAGRLAWTDMQKEPHLYVVSFSDFQMDAWSGHFGGEIRLAYWFDGKDTHVVTGGSINGSMAETKGRMHFSSDLYTTLSYHGPYAVSIPGVKVAGV